METPKRRSECIQSYAENIPSVSDRPCNTNSATLYILSSNLSHNRNSHCSELDSRQSEILKPKIDFDSLDRIHFCAYGLLDYAIMHMYTYNENLCFFEGEWDCGKS